MPSLIHTADCHLGAKFRRLGNRAEMQGRLVQEAFVRVCNAAREKQVDALLIAGDLFDSNAVPESLFRFATSELEKVGKSGIRVVITAGTHDRLEGNSILRKLADQNLRNVFILFPESPQVDFPEIEVTVCGFSNQFNKSTESPLSQLKASQSQKYKIAMVHASVAIEGKFAPDDYPVSVSEIEKSDWNYVAFGHWHRAQEVVKNRAWFSGSLETLKLEEKGSGQALHVEIADTGATVTPFRTGSINFDEVAIEIDSETKFDAIRDKILVNSDEQLIRTVTLQGVISPTQFIDKSELMLQAQDSFFALKILDKTTVKIDDTTLASFPDELVSGKFVRILKQEIDQEPDAAKKKQLEKALQIGLALLSGKEVL